MSQELSRSARALDFALPTCDADIGSDIDLTKGPGLYLLSE